MKNMLVSLIVILLGTLTSCKKGDDVGPAPVNKSQQLKITVGTRVLTATLYDNATARDFVALLPITVDLQDYANTEKIFYPASKLATHERNAVSDPAVGDINVYAPWGNVAIFYKSYSGSRDLIRIARITGGMDALIVPGSVTNVKFELIE